MTIITVTSLQTLKQKREKIVMLTCYDATLAHTASEAGVEILLVGDTMGMVLQGHDSTLPVTVADIAYHVACVRRGNHNSLIMADMPFMANATLEQTLVNGAILMRAGAHMIKIEGAAWLADSVRQLTNRGIPVCVHVGLTPQCVNALGGYKLQGRLEAQAQEIRADVAALEKAGAAMILVECVPPSLGEEISRAAKVPVIGIGAGSGTDGQVLVLHDMLGLSITGRVPSFVKNFMSGQPDIQSAIKAYVAAVKDVTFPAGRAGSSMSTVRDVAALRGAVAQARKGGRRVALVPTMGSLHDGHIALVKRAAQHAEFIVASIYVNALQFGEGEDLASYPQSLATDQEKLQQAGCHLVFVPGEGVMYPNGTDKQTRVSVPYHSNELCGASRPGHFDGVTTVVCKLFNMVQPDVAVFGEKDYQQLVIIRAMVRDLDIPIQVIGVKTVRDPNGLALSSRNAYLSDEQRAKAPILYRTLSRIADALRGGDTAFDVDGLLAAGKRRLQDAGFRVDYLQVCEATTLRPAKADDRQLVVLGAAFLGNTRLIDALPLSKVK